MILFFRYSLMNRIKSVSAAFQFWRWAAVGNITWLIWLLEYGTLYILEVIVVVVLVLLVVVISLIKTAVVMAMKFYNCLIVFYLFYNRNCIVDVSIKSRSKSGVKIIFLLLLLITVLLTCSTYLTCIELALKLIY